MKQIRKWKTALLCTGLLAALFAFTGCVSSANTAAQPAATAGAAAGMAETAAQAKGVYQLVTAEEAKQIMDTNPDAIVVDVREQSEYDAGHINGAKLLPLGSLATMAAEALPNKDATILVYCRSGRRSQSGANTLLSLGYTNVIDMGGISSWPYEVVTD